MIITKEEFDSLQVGNELINAKETIIVEFKMPNTIITHNLDNKYSGVYSLYELQDDEFRLKPKTKHLYGFPVGNYLDKNVFVACSDISLEDAKNNGKICRLICLSTDCFYVQSHINSESVRQKYAILLSDNVELVKE